ncbi:MAG: acyl carrier protein [Christensenellales bacterium]
MFEKVRKLFAEQLGISEDDIKMDSDIVVDLKADSLDIYTIICTVDSEMGISIPDEEVVNIKTIGDIVKYLEENK